MAVPHILIRVASSNSEGHNTKVAVVPKVALGGGSLRESIESIPRYEAKAMITGHLQWHYDIASEFTSWSSSLLSVSQLVNYKMCKRSCSATDLKIFVLDTSGPIRRRIYPAVQLLKKYDIESEGKLEHDYYKAEYLIHGRFDAHATRFRVVTLHEMMQCGLYEGVQELGDKASMGLWYRRVEELRGSFFSSLAPVRGPELSSFREIAELYGEDLSLPVMISFIALRLRELDSEAFVETIMEAARGLPLFVSFRSLDFNSLVSSIDETLQEVKQSANLMGRVCARLASPSFAMADFGDALRLIPLSLNIDTDHAASAVEPDSDEAYGFSEDSSDEVNVFFRDEFSDTDDEAEESNRNDDIMKMIEGDW